MPKVIPLGNRTVAVRLKCGAWAVVPTWNVDVAIGVIRNGVIEPWTSRLVERILRPGDTYVNVGANFGYYMVLGAQCVGRTGRVFAIEANPVLLPFLMRTIYWSGYPDVIRLYNRAASEEDERTVTIAFNAQFIGGGSVVLPSALEAPSVANIEDGFWENTAASHLVQPDGLVSCTHGLQLQRECRTARLDTLLGSGTHVDLLHMDIEGSEPAAIAGAQDLIMRSPGIAVIMEWSPQYCLAPGLLEHSRNMWDLFENLGYSWYRIRHEDFKPHWRAPRLSPIGSRDELFSAPHSDMLIVKDLRPYYGWWRRPIVRSHPDSGRAAGAAASARRKN